MISNFTKEARTLNDTGSILIQGRRKQNESGTARSTCEARVFRAYRRVFKYKCARQPCARTYGRLFVSVDRAATTRPSSSADLSRTSQQE